MATPRKRYFRVADQILREGWPDDVLATVVRLMAFLNGRWARDGVPNEHAGDAVLAPQDVLSVAGLTSTRRALERMRALSRSANLTSLSITEERRGRRVFVRVSWPKFPEFQAMTSPGSGEGRASEQLRRHPLETPDPGAGGAPTHALSATRDPRPASASRSKEIQPPPAAAPGGARSGSRTAAEVEATERLEGAVAKWARMFRSKAGETEDVEEWLREKLPRLGWPETPPDRIREGLWRHWKERWRDDRRKAEERQRDLPHQARKRTAGAPPASTADLLAELAAPEGR